MTIKFKSTNNSFSPKIEKVEIEKETPKFVFLKGYKYGAKRAMHSQYESYHDSFAEAHLYLINIADKKVKLKIAELKSAENALTTVLQIQQTQENGNE